MKASSSHPSYLKYAKTNSTKAIVYLHGFLGNKYSWQPVMEALPTAHLQIALDLGGHGEAKKMETKHWPSLEEEPSYFQHYLNLLQDDLKKIVEKEKIESMILVGYSMGGRLALQLALAGSLNIQGLIIESSGAGIAEEDKESRRIFDQELQKKLLTQPPEDFLESWYENPLFRGIKECSDFTEMKKNLLKNNFSSIASSLAYSSQSVMTNVWEKLNEVKIRSLIVCGDWDKKYKTICTKLQSFMRKSELCVIKNASHNTHFMNKVDYVLSLAHFLKEINHEN